MATHRVQYEFNTRAPKYWVVSAKSETFAVPTDEELETWQKRWDSRGVQYRVFQYNDELSMTDD